jgi:hypothetical protein
LIGLSRPVAAGALCSRVGWPCARNAVNEIILHHYDASPFSEKVRVVLGIKGLT